MSEKHQPVRTAGQALERRFASHRPIPLTTEASLATGRKNGMGLVLRSEWDAAEAIASGALVRMLADWQFDSAPATLLVPTRKGRTARGQAEAMSGTRGKRRRIYSAGGVTSSARAAALNDGARANADTSCKASMRIIQFSLTIDFQTFNHGDDWLATVATYAPVSPSPRPTPRRRTWALYRRAFP